MDICVIDDRYLSKSNSLYIGAKGAAMAKNHLLLMLQPLAAAAAKVEWERATMAKNHLLLILMLLMLRPLPLAAAATALPVSSSRSAS